MCGRYLFYNDSSSIMYRWIMAAKQQMSEEEFSSLSLHEVFPSQKALIITADTEGKAQLKTAVWGYPLNGKNVINARSETFERSPFFRGSMRCLVPASGYYEWSKSPRLKYFLTGSEQPVYLGGLCRGYEDGLHMVIVTEPAQEPDSLIHDRRPLLFSKDTASFWCREKNIKKALSYSSGERLMRQADQNREF